MVAARDACPPSQGSGLALWRRACSRPCHSHGLFARGTTHEHRATRRGPVDPAPARRVRAGRPGGTGRRAAGGPATARLCGAAGPIGHSIAGRRRPVARGRCDTGRDEPALGAVAGEPVRATARGRPAEPAARGARRRRRRRAGGSRSADAGHRHRGRALPRELPPRAAAGVAGGVGDPRARASPAARAPRPRLPRRRAGGAGAPGRGRRRRAPRDPARAAARVLPPRPDPHLRQGRQPHRGAEPLPRVRESAPPRAGAGTGAGDHGAGGAVPATASRAGPAQDATARGRPARRVGAGAEGRPGPAGRVRPASRWPTAGAGCGSRCGSPAR